MITLQVAAGVLLGFFFINRYIRDSSPFKAFFAELFLMLTVVGSAVTLYKSAVTTYFTLSTFEGLWFIGKVVSTIFVSFWSLSLFLFLCYLLYLLILKIEKAYDNF